MSPAPGRGGGNLYPQKFLGCLANPKQAPLAPLLGSTPALITNSLNETGTPSVQMDIATGGGPRLNVQPQDKSQVTRSGGQPSSAAAVARSRKRGYADARSPRPNDAST